MVAACRYPPLGHCSVMGAGPALGYRTMALGEVSERMNAESLLIAMLETPQGIANAATIAATRGSTCCWSVPTIYPPSSAFPASFVTRRQ